jgi:hypothetical protein
MNTDRITFTPYPNDIPLLEQAVKDKLFVSVSMLVREIVGNWACDQRRDKRLRLPAHHYTSRGADDYSEAE